MGSGLQGQSVSLPGLTCLRPPRLLQRLVEASRQHPCALVRSPSPGRALLPLVSATGKRWLSPSPPLWFDRHFHSCPKSLPCLGLRCEVAVSVSQLINCISLKLCHLPPIPLHSPEPARACPARPHLRGGLTVSPSPSPAPRPLLQARATARSLEPRQRLQTGLCFHSAWRVFFEKTLSGMATAVPYHPSPARRLGHRAASEAGEGLCPPRAPHCPGGSAEPLPNLRWASAEASPQKGLCSAPTAHAGAVTAHSHRAHLPRTQRDVPAPKPLLPPPPARAGQSGKLGGGREANAAAGWREGSLRQGREQVSPETSWEHRSGSRNRLRA